ncbi:MAG: hypothetical protein KDA84_16855, partial [Planctomycetaceae bacterium]|nr:hypothetical protein [Planctomycetaceae bacterium]
KMAANKPTAVHFSLIFFVMATIVAGVMAYMYYDDGREIRAQMEADRKEKESQKTVALEYTNQVNALKKQIGHEHPDVGLDPTGGAQANPQGGAPGAGASPPPNTVLGAMQQDIQQYSISQPPPPDYKTVIRELREALEAEKYNIGEQKKASDSEIQRLTNQVTMLQQTVQTHDTERAKAVQDRLTAETEHKKALQVVRDELTTKTQEYQKLLVEKQNEKNAHEQAIAEKDDRISRLVSINNVLQDRIKSATRTTFERPDGIVRWVDNSSHLVWINLGSADSLTVRTNFSVYKKNNRGVGVDTENSLKGPEDMKGSIEVTRILGPHLAEARILDEDYYDPIATNDPIYTPIWSPNQKEAFAFVGLIDLDDDGRSDRELLHDILSSASAKVQVEVDDDGNRNGGEIDEKTKFLVVGEIPALEDLTNEKEKEAAKRIHAAHKDLKEEAREQGVRVVTLNDFMAFIGYTPRQRVFRPGDRRPFALKSGSRSTGTGESIGKNRFSTGQTSGVYSRSKRLGQTTGTGQTSGAYRGSR